VSHRMPQPAGQSSDRRGPARWWRPGSRRTYHQGCGEPFRSSCGGPGSSAPGNHGAGEPVSSGCRGLRRRGTRNRTRQARSGSTAAKKEVREAAMATVLVVDDLAAHRQLAAGLLARAGRYEVLFAANGAEALKTLAHGHADVVLTDVLMPEMDGLELLRAVHR